MILELLLVRGQVALCSDSAIKRRFPTWNQQKPAWALLAVNRQMSAEAADIAFSSRNAFFVPFGIVEFDSRWPPIRRLDCAFSICDLPQSHSATLSDYRLEKFAYEHDHEPGSFERLPRDTKLDILHERKLVWLRSCWSILAEDVMDFNNGLELLRIDLKDCRCPIGCCWLGLDVMALLVEFGRGSGAPQRIEIIGAPGQEELGMEEILGEIYGSGKVSFVDREPSLLGAVAEEPNTEASSPISDRSSASFWTS